VLRIARLDAAPSTVTLPEAALAFCRRCAARGLAEGAVAFDRHRLEAFACFVTGRGLDDLTTLAAAVVRGFLAEQTQRSPAAAHHARATLSTFFRFLVAEEVVRENPVRKVERVRRLVASCRPRVRRR
jgi:site-specific recombinase XerD